MLIADLSRGSMALDVGELSGGGTVGGVTVGDGFEHGSVRGSVAPASWRGRGSGKRTCSIRKKDVYGEHKEAEAPAKEMDTGTEKTHPVL